jgi:hypothetical protein
MTVIESSDIQYSVTRHHSGGNRVVQFGEDAAFLFGEGGCIVPCRQRGSNRRLAFVTFWVAWDINHEPMVTVKEVPSFRVQAHLKALKRRGWAPNGAAGVDAATEWAAEEPWGTPFFKWGVESLEEGGIKVYHQGIWSPCEPSAGVRRDKMTAVATAVVFLPEGEDRLDSSSGDPTVDEFFSYLGKEL